MIHQYKSNGYNIVLDVNSGSVHVVDELAYDIIALYENTPADDIVSAMIEKYKEKPEVTRQEILDTISDIETLKKEGTLFARDEFRALAGRVQEREPVLKALCLHVAHDCNMACKYCFAGKGKYKGQNQLMSLKTGKRALDYLISNSGNIKYLDVDFFGGEPLMNFEVVKKLVEYGRDLEAAHNKKFRFTLTTNGVLLDDEVIRFANREMSNVVLSLDGRREVNDRMRGRGTYDLVLPGFKRFAEKRGDREYYVRGTYTHFNTDFASDILHMADLGFDRLAMEPVVAPPTAEYALTEDDLPVLLSEYERLGAEMAERMKRGEGFTFYHFMIDLEGGPCIYKRVSGCGVGTEYMAVTPEGELYPCHQFVGNPDFILGNIYDGVKNRDLAEEFRKCNIYSRPECDGCFARLYCGGGCAANAFYSGGEIGGIYELGCILHRKRIEIAIMLKACQASLAGEGQTGGNSQAE
ncbi:MAG: thioether cross-link-forming SCIFF peptide maturase [Clostridiales bacterium]|nr:thioether cross-link-forming SCIFF peptide maturase [Clostridiales bacterium]